MTEAVKEIFSKELDERQHETEERIVERMLKSDEPLEKIIKYTQVPMERIIAIAKSAGLGAVVV